MEIEDVASYAPKTKLWFPNKTEKEKSGYEWIEAEVLEDAGFAIKVKALSPVKLRSQSGSPFFNRETGKVIGMLLGGDEKGFYLCPARSLAKRLREAHAPVSLMESVK